MTTATATRPETATAFAAHVLQENMVRALDAIKPAVSTRSTLPITANVHIATHRGRLALTASDLDIVIRALIGAKVDVEGALTVPFTPLHRMIKASPSATVSLRQLPDGKLAMLCARADVTYDRGYDAADFPLIPEPDYSAPAIIMPAKQFAEAIRYVLPAVDSDDSRPVLTRIQLEADAKGVTLTAADGFRLAHAAVPHAEVPPECYGVHLLNPRALQAAAKLCARKGGYHDQVALYAYTVGSKPRITLDIDNEYQVTETPLSATFPTWRQLIPAEDAPGAIVTFDRDAFARDIKRASIIACDGSGIIRLTESPDGGLAIIARAEEIGRFECAIDAEIAYQGGATGFRWAGNMRYLQDMLATAGPTIRAHFRGSEEGAAFHSGPGVHLVMMMSVSWD